MVRKLQEKTTKRGREKKKTQNSNPPKKMTTNTYLSIITLNVNRLNAPTKRHRGWMDIKTRHTYMLLTRDPLQS